MLRWVGGRKVAISSKRSSYGEESNDLLFSTLRQ